MDEMALHDRLRQNHHDPLALLIALRVECRLTQKVVGIACGVGERTVRTWEQGKVEMRQTHHDRLVALATIASVLAETMTARGVKQWLMHKASWLDGYRPIEFIGTDPHVVLEKAKAVCEVDHDQ